MADQQRGFIPKRFNLREVQTSFQLIYNMLGRPTTANVPNMSLDDLNDKITDATINGYTNVIMVVTTDYVLTATDHTVVVKTNTATLSLPAVASAYSATDDNGAIYFIKNDSTNTNDITLEADGAELIDDDNTWTIPPGACMQIHADGTKWHIV
jgi:hypothetical protein